MFDHDNTEISVAQQQESLARFLLRTLIVVSAGSFLVFAALFGDMMKYNCQMQHVWFLCWFLGSLITALLAPMALWAGEGQKAARKFAAVLAMVSVLLLAIGGVHFILAFSQNSIVACPSDDGDADDSQHYGV